MTDRDVKILSSGTPEAHRALIELVVKHAARIAELEEDLLAALERVVKQDPSHEDYDAAYAAIPAADQGEDRCQLCNGSGMSNIRQGDGFKPCSRCAGSGIEPAHQGEGTP